MFQQTSSCPHPTPTLMQRLTDKLGKIDVWWSNESVIMLSTHPSSYMANRPSTHPRSQQPMIKLSRTRFVDFVHTIFFYPLLVSLGMSRKFELVTSRAEVWLIDFLLWLAHALKKFLRFPNVSEVMPTCAVTAHAKNFIKSWVKPCGCIFQETLLGDKWTWLLSHSGYSPHATGA